VVYENLEDNADKIMREFVRNVKLAEKTDFRMFGFNNLRWLYAGHCIKWVIFINGSFLKNGSETVQSMNMTLVSPLEWADGWRNILMHI